MTTNIHSINLPKIVQIGWGHHVDFCVWKNRPLLLAKGVCAPRPSRINPLYPSGATWRHRSTFIEINTCCLTAPSHHLHQRLFIIKCVLCYSFESSSQKMLINLMCNMLLYEYREIYMAYNCFIGYINGSGANLCDKYMLIFVVHRVISR